jgi:two-component system, cell cycle sensor histidine kinase and response regulator CckA
MVHASSMTQVVSVNQVVTDLTELFHRLLGPSPGLTLTLNLGASPSWVAMNQVLLEQVLVNLVVNARDAMPSGGVVTIVTSNDADQVAIEVRDTGIGMTDEIKGRIGEPLLSTVAGVVHRAGGRVEVITRYRHGTTFRVKLRSAMP